MEVRKKTPQEINEQLMRIMDYYLFHTNRADDETRKRIYNKVLKIDKTAVRYVDNIYKVAGIDPIHAMPSEVNIVWLYFGATKEQYTNNK